MKLKEFGSGRRGAHPKFYCVDPPLILQRRTQDFAGGWAPTRRSIGDLGGCRDSRNLLGPIFIISGGSRIFQRERDDQPLRSWQKPIIWQDFCWKLHENETNCSKGAASLEPPLDLSIINFMQFLEKFQQAQGPKTPRPIRSERMEWVWTWYTLGTLVYGLGCYGGVRTMYGVSMEWVQTEGGGGMKILV